LTMFYAGDSSCKECRKAAVKARYRRDFEKIQAYEKVRSKLPHRKLLAKKIGRRWVSSNREWVRERHMRWLESNPEKKNAYRKRYPERYAAHTKVGNAIRDGKLAKKPCEVCGELIVHAHHDDYSKPLEVRWLCTKHHALHHYPDDPHQNF